MRRDLSPWRKRWQRSFPKPHPIRHSLTQSLIAGPHSAKAEPAISYTTRHTIMPLQGIVYILTNKNTTTLYTGVTRNLRRRVAEHKLHINKGFSDRYNTEKLVYYEVYDLLVDGIHREKQLKKWHREWKEKLISDFNPTWEDLSDSIGLNEEYIQSVKESYENGYYDIETP